MTLFWYSQNLLCAINKWFQINSLVKINLANFTKYHSSFSTKVMNKWKFNHVNNDFSKADVRIFLNEWLESTLPNFRIRVKPESLKNCDSSRFESDSWLWLAHPCFLADSLTTQPLATSDLIEWTDTTQPSKSILHLFKYQNKWEEKNLTLLIVVNVYKEFFLW
jgi:hypothetical protein